MRESEATHRVHERQRTHRVQVRGRGSVRVGRPRERVRSHREAKDEIWENQGRRTSNARRFPRWQEEGRVRQKRASSPRCSLVTKFQTGHNKWNSNDGRHGHYRRNVVSWNAEKERVLQDTTDHGDWVVVSRRRKRNRETSRGRLGTNIYQRKAKRQTWRNKEDVTTFYFSRFPEEITEQDMWQKFQKWGKVWEVFISRTKNKMGHRFGFVRFKEVTDVQSLERSLDSNLFIGGQRVFVNRPKFDREKMLCTNQRDNVTRGNGRDRGAHMDNRIVVEHGRPRSYAEVVKETEPGHLSSLCRNEVAKCADKDTHSTVVLNTSKVKTEWLHKAWVGRLKNRGMFERVEEELKWVLEDDDNPTYWGDDWVLFPHMEDSRATRLIQHEEETGSSPIMELQRWSPTIRLTHRLTWALIWGLPPTVWADEYMAKVLVEIGEVVEVDEFVEAKQRMDVARVLIRTKMKPMFQVTVPATIDGERYDIHVAEDVSSFGRSKKPGWNSWLPPSPFSTQPNTPVSEGDDISGVMVGDDTSDGVSDDILGGFSDHTNFSSLPIERRDQWVQPLGRSGKDRSDSPSADVDQPANDNALSQQSPHVQKVQATHNGHFSENGSAFNAPEESPTLVSLLYEKPTSIDGHVVEIQGFNTCGEASGNEKKVIEEEHQKAWPREFFEGESAVVGQQRNGPLLSAKKVYVRRKEVLTSKGKAHQSESNVDLNLASKYAILPPIQEDSIELQCALLKEVGMSYGEDDNRIKGMLLDMENKDVVKAAEKGNKTQQL